MPKKIRQTRENLDLFAIAGLPQQTFRRNGNLKPAPPKAKPSRKKQQKATSANPVNEAPSERYLRDAEVAHRYGVGRQTVWRWAAKGALPEPIKLSVSVTRWRLSDLVTHENSLPKGAKGKVVRTNRLKTGNAGGQK
ncbi:AlpA family phage regulatory protein [Sulfitobacter sp.]|uniref:helix-turn-helix transcriptional regulator n=1 Tax=Sulfitobacter sp. TaxID=1903071 RepID=UPI00329A556C